MSERTPVAVLGTLAEFHREPIPYDLKALVLLVTRIQPDLLCLDMTPEQWRCQAFGDLPPEYREALLPLAYQTDIVVVPIAESQPPAEPSATGWRGKAILVLRSWLGEIQKAAPGPDAINRGPRHGLANLIYNLIASLAGEDSERRSAAHADHLSREVLELARREAGRRILVVVNVRYCHLVRHELRRHQEIDVRRYNDL